MATKKRPSHKSKAQQAATRASRKQLSADIAKMAKTANQRLREIEKRGYEKASPAYKYVERLHYDEDSAVATDSSGRMKWSTNTRGKTFQQLKHEQTELNRFLNQAKTSSVKGIRQMYSSAYDKFKEKYGTNMTFDEYSEMWQMSNIQQAMKLYGSEEIQRIVTKAMDSNVSFDDINEILAQALEEDSTLTDFQGKLETQFDKPDGFFTFHDSDEDNSPF